jgi:hypothetical protein
MFDEIQLKKSLNSLDYKVLKKRFKNRIFCSPKILAANNFAGDKFSPILQSDSARAPGGPFKPTTLQTGLWGRNLIKTIKMKPYFLF